MKTILDSIFSKDQKAASAPDLTQAHNLMNIWNAIADWMSTNLPDTTIAI